MELLNEYVVALVAAFCMGLGFIIKHSLTFIPNKYIPLILGVVGVAANVCNEGNASLPVIVGGLASGLTAVGAFELVRNIKK